MERYPILWPVFVQAALTFVLLFWTALARVQAVGRGEVRVKDIALGQSAWPPRTTQIANSFHNQLELPLLFYAVAAFALLTGSANAILVGLAWLFVALRLGHAFIHTTSNDVLRRFQVFAAGAVVLLLMWALLLLHLSGVV
jgi:hypothetical protein